MMTMIMRLERLEDVESKPEELEEDVGRRNLRMRKQAGKQRNKKTNKTNSNDSNKRPNQTTEWKIQFITVITPSTTETNTPTDSLRLRQATRERTGS